MDWTLSPFPNEHGEEGTKRYRLEEGFFRKFKPFTGIDILNEAIANSDFENIYILSNSPTEEIDNDKRFWLDKWLPAVPEKNRIFNRGFLHHGKPKAEIAMEVLGRPLEWYDTLVDDNITILQQWQRAGGFGIKKHIRGENVEECNWYGLRMAYLKQIAEMITVNASN